MEIRLDVDPDLAEELAEEADIQGFDDREAYLRWIVANRPMSTLSSTQAPAVASRVSALEERLKLVERQLGLDEPVDPDADLGAGGGPDETFETAGGGASLGDVEPTSEAMELDDPNRDGDEQTEAAAEDDDIAEAIGDVEMDDEE